MSELDLLQVQLGTESAWGTAVTPTVKLMGVEEQPVITPGVKAEVFGEQRGSHIRRYNSVISMVSPSAKFSNIIATYQDICYLLDNFLGQATPSGSSTYTRAYAAPSTADPSPRKLTVVSGGALSVYKLAGFVGNELTIKGESNQPWRIDFGGVAKDIATGALESLSDRDVDIIHANDTDLYIDAWDGTIGTTAISVVFYSFELNLINERAGKMGIGSAKAGGYRERGFSGKLKMVLELDTTSKAYQDAIIAATAEWQKQIRIAASSGSNSAQLDFAGLVEEAPDSFTDNDGILTFDVELSDKYNSELGNWFEASVVNGVATLP